MALKITNELQIFGRYEHLEMIC